MSAFRDACPSVDAAGPGRSTTLKWPRRARPAVTDPSPASWRDPSYVAAVVGVVAVGALVLYAALVPSPPSVETATFVLLWVTVPTTVAYEVARRTP